MIFKTIVGALVAMSVSTTVVAATSHAGTLDDVRAADTLRCGINPGLPGFSFTDDTGRWMGFEAAYCRALAAAVLGDADKITFVNLTGKTRFPALASGEVDILARNTTWTFSRDVNLGFTFIGIYYYDGQGFLGRKAARCEQRHRARRRLDLHPDRHHHRAQPRGLLPRPRHHLRAGADRDQRRSARRLRGGTLRTSTPRTSRAWRRRIRPSTTPMRTFLAPAIVTLLRYAERATSLTNRLALRQSHLGFAQHADNLFWGVAFTAHFVLLSRGQNAPNSLINLDHFLGVTPRRSIESACGTRRSRGYARKGTSQNRPLPRAD